MSRTARKVMSPTSMCSSCRRRDVVASKIKGLGGLGVWGVGRLIGGLRSPGCIYHVSCLSQPLVPKPFRALHEHFRLI